MDALPLGFFISTTDTLWANQCGDQHINPESGVRKAAFRIYYVLNCLSELPTQRSLEFLR